jgi:hypothetical protein
MNRGCQAVLMLTLIFVSIVIGEMFYKASQNVLGTVLLSSLIFLCGSIIILERKDPK